MTYIKSHGGAIRNESGVVNLEQCAFAGNVASGSRGVGFIHSPGSDGEGGAIHSSGNFERRQS